MIQHKIANKIFQVSGNCKLCSICKSIVIKGLEVPTMIALQGTVRIQGFEVKKINLSSLLITIDNVGLREK